MIETTASKRFAKQPAFRGDEKGSVNSGQTGPGRFIFTWLNVVCLDAPIVAVSWQWLFARSFGITPAKGATLALFLTAWLIYLADRLGDSLTLDSLGATSLRQRACLRWRAIWVIGIGFVALADLFVIHAQLDWRVRSLGIPLSLGALVYLVLNQRLSVLWRFAPLKELSIGFLFAAGTMVPLVPGLTSAMIAPWLLFAALCSMNCICIAIWERELDLAQRRVSLATVIPGIERAVLPGLGAICLTSLILASLRSGGLIVYLCLMLSAALLALIYFLRERIASDTRTALADLVLLTPVALFAADALGFFR